MKKFYYLSLLFFLFFAIGSIKAKTGCAVFTHGGHIESSGNEGQIRVYPNPAKDRIQIETDFSFHQVVIYNLLGQKMKSFTVDGSKKAEISVSDLSAGTYIVSVQNSGNISKNLKFTKID